MPTRFRLFPALALLLFPYGVFAQAAASAAAPEPPATPVTETSRSVLPTLKLPDLQDLKLPMPRTVRAANAVLGMARQRLALVIGNASVGSEVVLGSAQRDTQAVAAGLRAAGFVVMVREDLNADAMRANLKEFRERLQPGGVGFLYYTGVGAQVDGKNYVVPRGLQIDPARAEAQIQNEALPLQEMVDAVQGTAESPRYLVVDAGFTHPALAQLPKQGLAAQKMPPGTMALFAVAPDVATAPPEPAALPLPAPTDPRLMAASPFGRELVRSLVTPRISGAEVMRLTRGAMLDVTHGQQAPWIEGDSHDKDELAEPNLLDALLPRSPEEMAREALKQALREATMKNGGDVPVSEVVNPPPTSPQPPDVDDGPKSSRRTADTPKTSLPDSTLSTAASTAANAVASAATTAVGAAATAATVAAIASTAAAGQATTAASAASTVVGLASNVASMALGGSGGGSTSAAAADSPSRMAKPLSVASSTTQAAQAVQTSSAPVVSAPAAPPAPTGAPVTPAPAPVAPAAAPAAAPPVTTAQPAVSSSPPPAATAQAVPMAAGDLPVAAVMATMPAPVAAQSAAQLANSLSKAAPMAPAENRTQAQQGGGERPAYVPRVNPFGYAEGDTFTYRVTDTWKNQVIGSNVQSIEEVLPDGRLVGNGGQTRMDQQGRIQSTRYADGSQSQFEPCQDLWWSNPRRGESRSVDFDEFFQRADRSRGQTEWKGSLSVGRPRKIQLPAGEFDVVPIEGSGWYYEKYANGARNSGQWSRTVWYSTKLGHPVAIDIEDANNVGKLLRRERIELVHAQSSRAPQ